MDAMSLLIGFRILVLEKGVGGGEKIFTHAAMCCPPTCLPSDANVPAAVSVVSPLLSY